MFFMIALIVIALLAAVLIYAATRPDNFRVERSLSIRAQPEIIIPYINDFHRWSAWSPWDKIDPNAVVSFSGSEYGVGAIYEWSGNKNVGQGRMEIIESLPEKIVLKINFIKPFPGQNTIEFLLETQGEVTTVTQAMFGKSPFISKLMCLFMSMDKMVGGKYEEGLAALKAVCENN
jgi:hypothetical protein